VFIGENRWPGRAKVDRENAMKRLIVALSWLLAVGVLGCGDDEMSSIGPLPFDASTADGGGDDRSSCGVAGRSVACTGAGGCEGAQVCRADGTYGACDCGDDGPPPVAPSCSPEGTVAVCVGPDSCSGLQVCGDDGRFAACRCPEPPVDPARAVTGLAITAPTEGTSVVGPFAITGTAEGHVAAVRVSVGGGPWLVADGTEAWSVAFDPAVIPYGPVMIIAVAQGEDGSELQRWVQVKNTDQLVGTWIRTSMGAGSWDVYCVLTFRASGEFVTNRCQFSDFTGQSWRRLHGDVIAVSQAFGDDIRWIATLSADRETLVLKQGDYYWSNRHTFVRVHGDPPDPPDNDAGTDEDDGLDAGR
jgi:hypothetical protein